MRRLPRAKLDKDDSAYTDKQVGALTERVEEDEKRIVDLEKREKENNDGQAERIRELEGEVNRLSSELAELKKWGEDKWSVGKEELSRANQTAVDGNAKGNLALWILLPVAALVLLFAVFFFWPRKRDGQSSTPLEPGSRPKCPRCGWEHDPGDTACKNPACKT